MIHIRINKSKYYIQELNNLNKHIWENTLYNINEKQLKFKGAQYLLNKIIKLINYNIISINYTESQPSCYDPGDSITLPFYWSYNGIITIIVNSKLHRKTKYNINTIAKKLNKIYGYTVYIQHHKKV